MSETFWINGQPFSDLSGGATGSGQERFWWQGRTKASMPQEVLALFVFPTQRKPYWMGLPFVGLDSGALLENESIWWQGRPGVPLVGRIIEVVLAASSDYVFECGG